MTLLPAGGAKATRPPSSRSLGSTLGWLEVHGAETVLPKTRLSVCVFRGALGAPSISPSGQGRHNLIVGVGTVSPPTSSGVISPPAPTNQVVPALDRD